MSEQGRGRDAWSLSENGKDADCGLQKQQVTIADSHSVARLTLWEADVDIH